MLPRSKITMPLLAAALFSSALFTACGDALHELIDAQRTVEKEMRSARIHSWTFTLPRLHKTTIEGTSIFATVSSLTDLTHMMAAVEVSAGATVTPLPSVYQNYSEGKKEFVVRGKTGIEIVWTVFITVDPEMLDLIVTTDYAYYPGDTLTVETPAGIPLSSITYTWYRDGGTILDDGYGRPPGRTYVLRAEDVGTYITAFVSVTGSTGQQHVSSDPMLVKAIP